MEILREGGRPALEAYLIENLHRFVEPLAATMELFPVGRTAVLTGAGSSHPPLSGIHPHPIEEEKARGVHAQALGHACSTDREGPFGASHLQVVTRLSASSGS